MAQEFKCPTCGKIISRELLTIVSHTEEDIIEAIKRDHPNWVQGDGICEKCYEYYKEHRHFR